LVLRRLRAVPEAAVREKLESLGSKGQMSPLVVAEHEGELVLIDGFARQAAAVRMGLGTVAVEVVQLTAVQMKAQLYLRNRERGLSLVDECRLVRELCESDGLNQVEVSALLERHKSWVCRRLGLWKALSPRLLSEGAVSEVGSGSIRRLALRRNSSARRQADGSSNRR
jgi:ParB-like chromosome segregation protein Spo0J